MRQVLRILQEFNPVSTVWGYADLVTVLKLQTKVQDVDLKQFFVKQQWGCAKGAEKASCGEMVSKRGFGESVSFLPLKVFNCFKGNP